LPHKNKEEGRLWHLSWRNKNRTHYTAQKNEYRRSHPEKHLFIKAKSRAKRDGIKFSLQERDIIIPKFCPVLGIKLIPSDPNKQHSPSIDRLIPSKGYTKENIRIISFRANAIKQNATAAEIRAVAEYLERELGR
jgi:hypothetical protein